MKTVITLIALCISVCCYGQGEKAIRIRNFNTENGIALRDFDPVSYFKGPKPVKGTQKIKYDYEGITYYFASNENLEEFKKSPAKYEPAYGGWCAYHIGVDGKRERVDPTTFKIIEGKVYLFHNFNGKNYLLAWNKNEKKLKDAAEKNWMRKMH